MPWTRLMEVIGPHDPKSGKRGRPPIDLERMLRMCFVQQWYGLRDEAEEGCDLRFAGTAQFNGHQPVPVKRARFHRADGVSQSA